jgi:hypothetical protein
MLLLILLRTILLSRTSLALENLALRQQVAVLKRNAPRPRVRLRDRIYWVVLRRFWSGWRDSLLIVRPSTVVRWHRQGGDSSGAGDRAERQPFKDEMRSVGLKQIVTAYQAPLQNAHAERVIGTIRRECVDYVIVMDESHVRGIRRVRPSGRGRRRHLLRARACSRAVASGRAEVRFPLASDLLARSSLELTPSHALATYVQEIQEEDGTDQSQERTAERPSPTETSLPARSASR